MFHFHHEANLYNVYNRKPWSIRGGHLILKLWNPILAWREVSFSYSVFWVQVHRLPKIWKSKSNLQMIGALAGNVIEVDFVGKGGGVWKKFIRIKVEVNVANPIAPGFFLPRENLLDLWIGLKYEKLADVCFVMVLSVMNSSFAGKIFSGFAILSDTFLLPQARGYELIMMRFPMEPSHPHTLPFKTHPT